MIRKDYLMKLIEEAAIALAMIFGLRLEKQYAEALEAVEDSFEGFFGFSTTRVLTVDPDDLIRVLREDENLTDDHLTIMADFLKEHAEILIAQGDRTKGLETLKKGLIILEHLNEAQKDLYSFDRVAKIGDFEKRIEDEIQERGK